MANLPAVAADGVSVVYLKSFGTGTDLDPFVPGNALIDGDGNFLSSLLLGTERALTVALVDASGNQILNFGGDATAANQVTANNSLASIDGKLSGTLTVDTGLSQPLTNAQLRASPVPVIDGFSVPSYDHISLGYTGENLTTVTYKTGGGGGTTVATLTLAYDGNGNITSVTKS